MNIKHLALIATLLSGLIGSPTANSEELDTQSREDISGTPSHPVEEVDTEIEYEEEAPELATEVSPPSASPVREVNIIAEVPGSEEVEYSTKRFTITETNDAALMGLQEAVVDEDSRPNDVGYTHGITIEYEDIDTHLFGMNGALKVTYTSDLITEYKQVIDNSIQSFNENRISAIDVYRLGFEFEKHAGPSGLRVFFGTGAEYITNTSPLPSGLSFFSGRERQAGWHKLHESTDYTYYEGDKKERYSINSIAGLGFEKALGSLGKVELKAGYLLKSGESEQARKESKAFGSFKITLNDHVKSANYYRLKSDRFTFYLGANGEYGQGKRLNGFAGFSQNIDGFLGQFELSFSATVPLVQNFFDFSDFTTPRVFDEQSSLDGGIIDYEPVYTLSLTTMW